MIMNKGGNIKLGSQKWIIVKKSIALNRSIFYIMQIVQHVVSFTPQAKTCEYANGIKQSSEVIGDD